MHNIILKILGITALLLAVPLLFRWDWNLFDYVVMGALLVGTGLSIVLASRKLLTARSRIIAITIIVIVFFLIWAELAVGIFGSPIAGS